MKRFAFFSISLFHLFTASLLAQSTIKPTFVSGPGRGEEGASMVCDGQFNTKWCIDERRQMPYIVVLDAGTQTPLAEYGLVTGDDTSAYPERNPVTWRVSGSNDQQSWTLLDDRKNDRSLPADNFQEYRFTPTAPGASGQFRYFRFEFIRMAGGSRIQLSEICLYRTRQMPIKATFSSGTGREGKEGASMVCDGHLFSKWCVDEPRVMPYTVVLDAGGQTPVSEYRFYTGDDTHSYPERNPVTWRLSGSNDKQNWTTLDEQKNNRSLRDENEQEYRFKTATTGQYRYYRFEFIKMTAGTRLQLSEIKLYK